jgi:transcriptional regulator with XRE-family HTH domain
MKYSSENTTLNDSRTQMTKPKYFIESGEAAKLLRSKLGMNQADFWSRISVTQSGGSRYESGRNLPKPVRLLLHLAYAPEKQAMAMLKFLRQSERD